jgi:diguanylate cyclase (GGDEF)-like protein
MYDKRKFAKYFSIIFIIILIPIIIISLYAASIQKEKMLNDTYYDLSNYQYQVMSQISKVSNDVNLLNNVIENYNYFNNEDDDGESSIKEQLTAFFVQILEEKSIYSQIRVIDIDGNEIIRVNNNEIIKVVDQDQLQNKKDRDYFIDVIALSKDSIYISNIDLNVENGEIEIINGEPVPTIRFATPLYSNDEVSGIVIINVLADQVLSMNNTLEYNILDDIEVVNSEGYYLVSDAHLRYGFKYDNDETFFKYNDYSMGDKVGFNSEEIESITYSSYYMDVSNIENFVSNDLQSSIKITSAEEGLYFVSDVDFNSKGAYNLIYLILFLAFISDLIISFVISKLLDSQTKFYDESINTVKMSANYDNLTKLGNRFNLRKYVKELMSKKESFALLFLDLDGFKAVNDTFGHDIGDLALIEVSKRYKESVRRNDKVFRLGGDEFVIVLVGCEDKKIITEICKNIIKNVSKVMLLDNNSCKVGVSIGVTIHRDEIDYDTILKQADKAMYSIKNTNKNDFCFYDEQK